MDPHYPLSYLTSRVGIPRGPSPLSQLPRDSGQPRAGTALSKHRGALLHAYDSKAVVFFLLFFNVCGCRYLTLVFGPRANVAEQKRVQGRGRGARSATGISRSTAMQVLYTYIILC